MVKLLESCVIKPAKETPTGLISLSEFDRIAARTYARVLYFYPSPIQCDSAINNLKDSLANVLVPFYPLAGRLQEIGEGRFEVDCNSYGVMFFVAESTLTIEDFGNFHPSETLQPFVPRVDLELPLSEQPLFLVQFTKLNCGGVCLGLATSHIIADGPSSIHFTTEWARLTREGCKEFIGNKPFLDRSVLNVDDTTLPTNSFDQPGYSPAPLLVGQSDAMEEKLKDSVIVTLKLSKCDADKIKHNANKHIAENTRPYSSFEAVSGHIWRCACKARRHLFHQVTRLYFPMDVRNRLEPPLPKFYYGNAMCRGAATSTCGELLSNPVSHASSKIREAINTVSNEYIRSAMHWLKNLKDLNQFRASHSARSTDGAFFGNPNMMANSWSRLSQNAVDFGWGKQIYFGPALIGGEGRSYMIQNSEEDGSFLVIIHLQADHIEDFKKFFFDEI